MAGMTTSENHDGHAAEFTIERVEGDVMAVNSYLVQGPDGIVVVDGQLTVSDAAKVRAAVAATGRDLAGVVVTHPHPDHYAGAGAIAGDTPIVATRVVDAVIRRDDATKAEIVGPMMGAEWPADRRFPDRLVDPGDTVELGGLAFRVSDSGPGESHDDTLWRLDDRTVFAGDVAYNQMHAFLADAHHTDWLEALATLEADLRDDVTLYLGHGAPAGKAVLAAQRDYVKTFVAAVGEHSGDSPEERQAAVVDRMRPMVSDQRLSFLMELSIEPVHAALTS